MVMFSDRHLSGTLYTTTMRQKLNAILQSPLRFFVAVSLFVGLIFILIIPPFQTPDEGTHFSRAYQISQFDFIGEEVDGSVTAVLPKSILETQETVNINSVAFHGNVKYRLSDTKRALHIPLEASDTMKVDVTAAAAYPPVAYLPQALAIGSLRLFDAPPVLMMYAARLANLVAWVFLVGLAIYLMPAKKWALAALGLLPMMVAQAMSPGIDVATIGLSVVFIAYILRIRSSGIATSRQITYLTVLMLGMILAKPINVFLLPLIFLLPRWVTPVHRDFLVKVAIATIPVVIFLLWTLASSTSAKSESQLANNQDVHGQIQYLLSHPLHILTVLTGTFFLGWGDEVVRSFIGNFGWTDTPLPALFCVVGYILVAYLVFVQTEKKSAWSLGRGGTLLWIVVMLSYIFAIVMALYVGYTPVGFDIVVGLQGRYFLLLPILLLPICIGTGLMTSKRRYRQVAQIGTVVMLVASIATIIFRYYISLI